MVSGEYRASRLYSLLTIRYSLPYRLVHGHELRSVGKRRLDLHVVDHLRDPLHDLRAGEHLRARLHQFGDSPAVARALEDEIGDQRHRFRMIELDAALKPPPRHHGGNRDQQLVLLTRRQVHRKISVNWSTIAAARHAARS